MLKIAIACDVALHTFRNALGHASIVRRNNNDDDCDVQVAKCKGRHSALERYIDTFAYKF